jgi:hypothetical protein
MLKLSDIGGLGTRTVKVRGRDVVITILSAADREVIGMAQWPLPEPPMAKDRNKGSNAEPEPVLNDPDYLRERAGVVHQNNAMIVAAALDVDIGAESVGACTWTAARQAGDAAVIQYLRAAAGRMVLVMTEPEIFGLADEANTASVLEEIPKLFRDVPEPAAA